MSGSIGLYLEAALERHLHAAVDGISRQYPILLTRWNEPTTVLPTTATDPLAAPMGLHIV